MARFIIQGRRRIAGTLRLPGNKNAALPMLAAALLTDEPVVLRDVPDIIDVQVMLELLAALGVEVTRDGSTVTLRTARLRRRRPDAALCRRVRASILLAGPLVARFGSAAMPPPGGDVIGRRRLDAHFFGLQALGIDIRVERDHYALKRRALQGADLVLDEASVTATENILMAAVLAPGVTTIFNAACEPHVEDLGILLTRMGARIDGLGTNRLRIEGVASLHGAEAVVRPDYIEAGSYAAAAAVTGGALRLENPPGPLETAVMIRAFGKLGFQWAAEDGALVVPARQGLRVRRAFNGDTPKIEDGPWPAFPSDLMSMALVLATQARGTVLFFEKMFESRMYFVDRLIEMGAQIIPCDPHRVVVNGPSRLHGSLMSSPDIRAGMALIVAALCARGESVIENAQMIDRGYQRIDETLRSLGAGITRAP